MVTKLIKTEAEYEAALERIADLMGAAESTPEADELELLTLLVEVYEDEHHPIPLPDPVSAIRFGMEQQGLSQGDLVPYLGSKSKVSEVLSGKRSLSLSMIRRLHDGLAIPLAVLVQATEAAHPGSANGVKLSGTSPGPAERRYLLGRRPLRPILRPAPHSVRRHKTPPSPTKGVMTPPGEPD